MWMFTLSASARSSRRDGAAWHQLGTLTYYLQQLLLSENQIPLCFTWLGCIVFHNLALHSNDHPFIRLDEIAISCHGPQKDVLSHTHKNITTQYYKQTDAVQFIPLLDTQCWTRRYVLPASHYPWPTVVKAQSLIHHIWQIGKLTSSTTCSTCGILARVQNLTLLKQNTKWNEPHNPTSLRQLSLSACSLKLDL